MDTPVVLLVFNRPAHTAQVFRRVRDARPRTLFVVADGPRPNRFGEAEQCAEVRRLIEAAIDWPCELVRDYSDVNLGCARRISSGISRAFERVEEAIILEDDCLPELTFFRFCTELLNRYRDIPVISQIGGANFQKGVPRGSASYYFSRYTHCWGWATWRRAWSGYQHDVPNALELPILNRMRRGERVHWRYVLSEMCNGRIDTWDYRWQVASWKMGACSVIPQINLVTNIGFGPEATHTTNGHELAALPTNEMPFPLRHPGCIESNEEADAATAKLFYRTPSVRLRMKQWINRFRSKS